MWQCGVAECVTKRVFESLCRRRAQQAIQNGCCRRLYCCRMHD